MLERMEVGDEKDVQKEKLEQMEMWWNEIKEKIVDMQKCVQVVYEVFQKYDQRVINFREWFQDVEKKVSKIYFVLCDDNELDERFVEFDGFVFEIELYKLDFDELNELVSIFMDVC